MELVAAGVARTGPIRLFSPRTREGGCARRGIKNCLRVASADGERRRAGGGLATYVMAHARTD